MLQLFMMTFFKRTPSLRHTQQVAATFVNEEGRQVEVPHEFLCLRWTRQVTIHSQSQLGLDRDRPVTKGGYSQGFPVSLGENTYYLKLGTLAETEDSQNQILETVNEHRIVCEMKGAGVFESAPPSLVRPFKVGAITCSEINGGVPTPGILYEMLPDAPLHDSATGFSLLTKYSLSDIRQILLNILPGLAHLHAHRYAHRDICPHNLTATRLYDYGKTTSFDTKFEDYSFFQPYLPPELCFENAAVPLGDNFNQTLDLWQLGCTLFHLAIGSYPFELLDSGPSLANVKKGLGLSEAQGLKTTPEGIYLLMTTHLFMVFDRRFAMENTPELASFCDLVSKLLQINPSDRTAVADLLNHPFLTSPCRPDIQLSRGNKIRVEMEDAAAAAAARMQSLIRRGGYTSLRHLKGLASDGTSDV